MSLKWFPKVSKCCFCVKNLEIASMLIAVYSLIVGFTSVDVLYPFCSNQYSGAAGVAARAAGAAHLVAGLAVAVAAVMLVVSIILDNPDGDIYVVTALIRIAVALVHRVLCLLSMWTKQFKCPDQYCYDVEPEVYFILALVLDGLLHSLLMAYFAIVVNSLEENEES